MLDRQALFNQLLDYLHATPELPEYLGEAPDSTESFDPYQMVSEWIALRQEMKQQGKLLQVAQERLQQELEAARSQNAHLHQQLATAQQQAVTHGATQLAAQEKQLSKAQESLLRNLLNVLDSLDRACLHWQEQKESEAALPQVSHSPKGFREKLANWLAHLSQKVSPAQPSQLSQSTSPASPTLTDMLSSDRAGVDLIRRNLLDILRQQQITPITAQGHPFNAQQMYALGRQPSPAPENTVIQEVVRGYKWGDRVLREAQVIVSGEKGE